MARYGWSLALGSASVCLLAGCLRDSLAPAPPRPPRPRPDVVSRPPAEDVPPARSDYNVSRTRSEPLGEPREERQAEAPPVPEVVLKDEAKTTQATAVIKPGPAPPPPAPPAKLSEQVLEPVPPAPAVHTAPDPPVVRILRCLLDKHPDEAADLLRRYDPSQQELLRVLLPLAARSGGSGLDGYSPEELAVLLDQFNAVAQSLRARAPLALDRMCFCSCIRNFGDYEPLPGRHPFQAGTDGHPGERVQVYVEVRNFTSRPHGPYHETTLTSRLEILDFSRKQVVWSKSFDPCVDRSRSPRQDYFINFQFFLPPRIPQGDYTLRVQVWDGPRPNKGRPAPRAAECSLDFRVRGNADHRTSGGDIRPLLRTDPAE